MSEGSHRLDGTRRIVVIVIGLVLAVLLYAWIDGGEEPLRPISEPVPLPERAR